MSEHTAESDARLRGEAERAAATYDELLTLVQASPVGAVERRLHTALGDLAHAVLTHVFPAGSTSRP